MTTFKQKQSCLSRDVLNGLVRPKAGIQEGGQKYNNLSLGCPMKNSPSRRGQVSGITPSLIQNRAAKLQSVCKIPLTWNNVLHGKTKTLIVRQSRNELRDLCVCFFCFFPDFFDKCILGRTRVHLRIISNNLTTADVIFFFCLLCILCNFFL